MAVSRIVPYLHSSDVERSRRFYEQVIGLGIGLTDPPRIVVGQAASDTVAEVIVLTHEIHPGAPIPAVLIEVDDVDEVHARAVEGGHAVVYPLTDEPWDVRRFFVTDPDGAVVNVLQRLRT